MTMNENYAEALGIMLEHKGFTDDEIDAYFLEHHGVKGQKWGVRRAARQRNKALNKASRQTDRQKHEQTVQKARDRIQGGKQKAELQKAKAQFKTNKQELGSREARKILNKTREKHWNEQQVAQQAKNGKEVATALLVAGGFMAISMIASGAAGSAGRSRGF